MAKAGFKSGTSSQISSAEIINGQFLYETNTNKIYLDYENSRHLLNSNSGSSASIDTVTEIDDTSTDNDIPTAQAVYEFFMSIVNGNEVRY